MLKKRPAEPVVQRRRVQTDTIPNKVFSYYANRNPYDGGRTSSGASSEEVARSKRAIQPGKLRMLIGFLLVIVALVGVAYNSILSQDVVVRVSGKPEDRLLLQDARRYQADMQELLGKKLLNKSKLTINTTELSEQILSRHPELAGASLALPLIGDTIVLQLEPAPAVARLVSVNGSSYILGSNGQAISSEVDAAPVSTPVITDQSGLTVAVGSQVLPRDDMRFIIRLQHQITAQHRKIESMVLPAAGRQLHVKFDGRSYIVKFSFEADVLQQVGAYRAVEKRLDATNVTPAEYIDVRVGDRAYYK